MHDNVTAVFRTPGFSDAGRWQGDEEHWDQQEVLRASAEANSDSVVAGAEERPTLSSSRDVRFAPPDCPRSGSTRIIFSHYGGALRQLPKEVFERVARFAPGWEHRIYDERSMVLFLKKQRFDHFLPALRRITIRALAVDAFRFAALWACGGVWMNIGLEPVYSGDGTVKKLEDLLGNGDTVRVVGSAPPLEPWDTEEGRRPSGLPLWMAPINLGY